MSKISTYDINRAAFCSLSHYVPFSYYARAQMIIEARGGIANACICSAFVMETKGIWWLVTAGHVLDEINKEQADGYDLGTFRLWDGWAAGAAHKNWVSFRYFETTKARINKDGLDYGIIHLNEYYVSHLKANNVRPIGQESFKKNWPDEFHAYAMIGTPQKTVSLEHVKGTTTRLTQSTTIIHLEKELNPPSELILPNERFYARISEPENSAQWLAIGGDIAGMSGGPILGVRRDDDGLKYWVIGVQSAWFASARVIAACYFQEFARLVEEAVNKLNF
jgi:hypothetical protein